MSEERAKTLAQKLAEACNEVGSVAKKGRNAAQNYDYVKAADVAKEIRHKLFKRGIVIIPSEEDLITEQLTFVNAKGETRMANQVKLKTAYHITDGTEMLVMNGWGVALDSGDKAIYKAKTGALKYFLRGLGLIPDEKDDPEADEKVDKMTKHIADAEEAFDQRAEGEKKLTPSHMQWVKDTAKNKGVTDAQLLSFMTKNCNTGRIENVLRRDFDKLRQFVLGQVPLQDALEASLEAVNGKKPSLLEAKQVHPTQHDWARLFASAGERGIQQSEIKQYYSRKFKVESGTELTVAQFKAVEAEVGTWKAPSILVEAE